MRAIASSALLVSGLAQAGDLSRLPHELTVSLAYVDALSPNAEGEAKPWAWERTLRDPAGRLVEYTEGYTVSVPDPHTGAPVEEGWPTVRKIYMWSPEGRLVAYSHEQTADPTVAWGCLEQVETILYSHDAAGDVIGEIRIAGGQQRACTFSSPWRGSDQSDPVTPMRRRPRLGVQCETSAPKVDAPGQ